MGTIVILGTANAVPDDRHENTHLLVQEGKRTILVDCTGNPLAELKRAGVNPDQLTDVILTHFHPDHVSGVPLLLMDLWLSGRKHGIRIHGLADTLGRMQTMMKLFDCESWPNFFTVDYHILPDIAQAELLADGDFIITASPVKHLIPTIGVRVEFVRSGKVVAYSSDTEPYQNVVDLGLESDILIHEATGTTFGHSTPRQAGEIAQAASAKSLYLIHYPADLDEEKWLWEARQSFTGLVYLAGDYMRIEL
jgi:ribonuclease Z